MNDIIKGALELRDKQGNFNKHYFETSADMVKCDDSGTTVADILSNISATTAEFADEADSTRVE